MEGIIYIALSLLTLGFGLAFFHEKKKRVSSKISEKQNYDEIQRFKHIYSILEKDFRALDLKNKSLKTKEAKSENFDTNWGRLQKRAEFFELAAASAIMAAGANVIVMNYPPNITIMKGLR